MPRHTNIAVEDHPLVGTEHTYLANETPYSVIVKRTKDREPGTLIIAAGMRFTILAVFHNWNGIEDLTIFYVHCHETQMRTHVSPREADIEVPA